MTARDAMPESLRERFDRLPEEKQRLIEEASRIPEGTEPPDVDWAAMAVRTSIDNPERCQCGHTRREHESRYDAPNHCTHRCVPPWVARPDPPA